MQELNTSLTYDWFIQSISEVSKTTIGSKLKIEFGCVQAEHTLTEYYTHTKAGKLGDRLQELVKKLELVKANETPKADARVYLKKGMHLKAKVFRRWIEAKDEHCIYEMNYDTILPANAVAESEESERKKKPQFTTKDLFQLRKIVMGCTSQDDARAKVLSSAPELEKAFAHFTDSGELKFE